MSNLHILMERYINQIKDLESRMADAKRKLEVVMETTRLLEEEGLSEESPSDGSAPTEHRENW